MLQANLLRCVEGFVGEVTTNPNVSPFVEAVGCRYPDQEHVEICTLLSTDALDAERSLTEAEEQWVSELALDFTHLRAPATLENLRRRGYTIVFER